MTITSPVLFVKAQTSALMGPPGVMSARLGLTFCLCYDIAEHAVSQKRLEPREYDGIVFKNPFSMSPFLC